MPKTKFVIGQGRTALHVEVRRVGEDLVILVNGGEAHIGSVAVAVPRPSLDDSSSVSATTSVFNMTGHKDDYLSLPVANQLGASVGRPVVVIAGFHLDAITKTEIEEVLQNLNTAIKRLIEEFPGKKRDGTPSELNGVFP